MSRDGPGTLLNDLQRFKKEDVVFALKALAKLNPDLVVLQGIDFDHQGLAMQALLAALSNQDMPRRYFLQPRSNSGIPTGFDLDRDGYWGDPEDAQGYGLYPGQNGIALISKYPLVEGSYKSFSKVLWQNMGPDYWPKNDQGADYFSVDEGAKLRLFSRGLWQVGVKLPEGTLSVLFGQASSPVFDGPEDRNGLRNSAQIAFIRDQLKKMHGEQNSRRVVFVGGLNNDPNRGEGLNPNLIKLLESASLQDVVPISNRLKDADVTVHWPSDPGPGPMRVDYILPDARLKVLASGIDELVGIPAKLKSHLPVWIDVVWE